MNPFMSALQQAMGQVGNFAGGVANEVGKDISNYFWKAQPPASSQGVTSPVPQTSQQLPPWMTSPVPASSLRAQPIQPSGFENTMGAISQGINTIGRGAQGIGNVIGQGLQGVSGVLGANINSFTNPSTIKMFVPTAAPTPTPHPVLPIQINIPSSTGQGMTQVPTDAATAIFNAFDKYGEATNAAQVLHHPMQVSGTPEELAQHKNWWGNTGENPGFRATAVNKNADGTLDRGLFQVNSGTFAGMQKDPFWGGVMQKYGINNYDDMDNIQKNAIMARLILMRGNWNSNANTMVQNPSYQQWYGAPQTLRTR